ncbi:hypothetical protein GLOIN_2v1874283 [Rhizophagus irregularis DAOM 181602=DAOM 197198]|nr:hypothetical protein GLOIN_2v1874283 [Rhizophagus irregularis DAOM 181602=DAOM 197198]GBC48408.1 hypothetical protein GLOIN_2v1874283 [Rhizophagus irregularis DAOM 181602=DAOM 197198]
MWTDRQLRVLINERKNENDNFYELSGNMKHNFWKGLASKINLEFGITYTERQCKEKFNGLKMQLYIEETIYDIAHEINTTSHTTTPSSSPLHSPICSPISPLRSHSSSSPTPLRHSSPTPLLRHSSPTPYRLRGSPSYYEIIEIK